MTQHTSVVHRLVYLDPDADEPDDERVLAYIEREHKGPNPWIVTVTDPEWHGGARTPAAGRYSTTAGSVEEAQAVLDQVGAALVNYRRVRDGNDALLRDFIARATKEPASSREPF